MVVKNIITVKTHWFCATSVTINRAPRQYQKGKTDICSLKPQDDFVQVFHSSSHCYITLQYSLSCQHGGETGIRNYKCTTVSKSDAVKKPAQPKAYAQT